jgi:hypothetical protein
MSGTLSGQKVDFDALKMIEPPEATKSYVPVLHHELADMVRSIGSEVLHDFSFHKEEYALAREGNQLFAVHSYKNSSTEMGLSIGFRNSYDKSLSLGVAVGGSVFVCSNLVFNGDVTIFRKHTSNVLLDLKKLILNVIFSQKENYNKLIADSAHMKSLDVTDDTAFRLMGLIYGRGIVTPRQLPVIKKEWLEPTYPVFEERTLWSFYNACTEALKTAPPALIMEKHVQLHNVFFNRGVA